MTVQEKKANIRRAPLILPLKSDPSSRFIPWITGFVLFMMLVVGFFLCLHHTFFYEQATDQHPQVTLEIPFEDTLQPRIESAVLKHLSALPFIEKVRAVPFSHLRKMMCHFLGEEEDYIPYPLLIHVWSKMPTLELTQHITQALSPLSLSPHYVKFDRTSRSERFLDNALSTMLIAGFLVLSFCVLMILALSTSTYLKIHKKVIELFILMGAQENFIGRQLRNHLIWVLCYSFVIAFSLFLVAFFGFYFVLDGLNLSGLFLRPFLLGAFGAFAGGVIVVVTCATLIVLRAQVRNAFLWINQAPR